MANSFERQIRLFAYFAIGVLLGCASVSAFAAGGLIGYCNSTNFSSGCFSSAELQAKNRCGNTTNMRLFGDPPPMSCNSSYCLQQKTYLIDVNGSSSTSDDCFATINAYYCPDGKNWDGSACSIPDPCSSKAGQFDNGGNPQITQLAGASWYKVPTSDGKLPNPVCINGCYADPYAGYDFIGVGGAGTYEFQGNPKYNGQSCTTADSSGKKTESIQKNTPEYDCVKSGKSFGYFNGNVVCTDATSKGGSASKTTTTTNNDGSSTKVDVKTTMNCTGDGSCTTTTTTTTTTYNPDGSVKGTDVQNKSETSGGNAAGKGNNEQSSTFCKENPDSPLCKTGSFSGSCSAEPACNGDPVQCATAQATWKTRCALEPTQDVMTAGQQVINGDQQASDALRKTSVSMSSVDTTGGGSSGSCPADKVVNIYGDQNLTIRYSSICGAADLMRIALLAIAGFAAAMIITGGIK